MEKKLRGQNRPDVIEFVKKNRTRIKLLQKSYKLDMTAKGSWGMLISEARYQLKYSPNTLKRDIWSTLQKAYRNLNY